MSTTFTRCTTFTTCKTLTTHITRKKVTTYTTCTTHDTETGQTTSQYQWIQLFDCSTWRWEAHVVQFIHPAAIQMGRVTNARIWLNACAVRIPGFSVRRSSWSRQSQSVSRDSQIMTIAQLTAWKTPLAVIVSPSLPAVQTDFTDTTDSHVVTTVSLPWRQRKQTLLSYLSLFTCHFVSLIRSRSQTGFMTNRRVTSEEQCTIFVTCHQSIFFTRLKTISLALFSARVKSARVS